MAADVAVDAVADAVADAATDAAADPAAVGVKVVAASVVYACRCSPTHAAFWLWRASRVSFVGLSRTAWGALQARVDRPAHRSGLRRLAAS